ncbi:MAG: hypothetical protein QOD39_4147 [Mycobacterium sp.]|nr:hypothetical protein [Mycobacterium sp.]
MWPAGSRPLHYGFIMRTMVVERIRRTPTLFHFAKAVQACLTEVRRVGWRVHRRRAVAKYLASTPVEDRGLVVGTGHHAPTGWLATDLDPTVAHDAVFMDAAGTFPFPDASFTRVHSEHMIEHVSLEEGRSMLAECARVLVPGGRLRVATPDLARLASLVATPGGPSADGKAYVQWIAATFPVPAVEARSADVLNHGMRSHGHCFLYDESTLRTELSRAAFNDVRRCPLNDSDDPRLRGLETHALTVGGEEHVAWETMVFEATRP